MYARLEERDWLLVNEDKRPSVITSSPSENPDASRHRSAQASPDREFQIVILARAGIGVSLVSSDPPEELLYAFMSNVVVDYQSSTLHKLLDGSIQNIQVGVARWSRQRPF
jgi:hypothetical protein